MIQISDALLSLVLLSVLLSLSSNRLVGLVRIMAFQGIVVSLVPLFLNPQQGVGAGSILFLQIMILIKGVLIPGFMYIALNKVKIRTEVEPFVGYHASLFIGLAFIVISAYITERLNISLPGGHALLLITAITTMASGLFLLMTRRKAITQVIGYLMMENGIYLVGAALAKESHTQYVVEFGVLLDLLVGVMVMGIVLHNINSAFDDVDTALLGRLKD
ncbi:MAG: hydrogenase [Desulfurivibrio sp.]|nr:MAG: hydrogenase [Desulfurivibrio sp.]